jgi:hypothetical protein
MNDKEFDKHFREGLSEEVEHPFDDKLWDSLSQRLDEHDKGTGVLGSTAPAKAVVGFRNLYWLAPLLLLLGTNVWFMWNAHKTQQANETLMDEMQSLKTILEKRDTVVKTQTIYKTDTIYIDRKISGYEKKISSFTNPRFLGSESTPSVFYNDKRAKSNFQANKNTLSESYGSSEKSKTDLSNFTQKPIASVDNPLVKLVEKNEIINPIVRNTILSVENKEEIKTEIGYKSVAAQTLITEKLPLLMPSIMLLPMVQKQSALAALNDMPIQKPVPFRRFYFGLSGSWLNYQTAWFNNSSIEVFKNQQSYQVGLRMEYALNKNWRLMFGTDYCPFDINISWQDARYNLPDIPEDYRRSHKMKSVEAKEPLLNGFLGAKYIFNGLRARPYLGLAYSAMKVLPYAATYHMQNLWTQADSDIKVENPGATISNLMMLTGGYEFKLGGRFVAQTEAFLYKDLNKEQKMFDLFGLRATVLARF